MRLSGLILAVTLCTAAGCGDDAPPAPPRAVALEVLAPADAATVDAESVEVRGRVRPAGAAVQVLGHSADVSAGTFTASVPLNEGANVIDVAASAPGRRPASTAVRVVREVPVEVPALEGESADGAIKQLRALRLEVDRRRGGGLLDDLLPGEPSVCSLDPPAGTPVKPGSTVTVEVARHC
jgi:hypothetical protein